MPEHGEKPEWHLIGYFGALTEAQAMKKRTYSKVKRILLDEAVIDKRLDRFHNYLPHGNCFDSLCLSLTVFPDFIRRNA